MVVSAAPPISDQELATMGIEGIHVEAQNGDASPRVELQMFSRQPVIVQGASGDAEIRRVLTYVIVHPQQFGAGVRLDSLDVLGTIVSDPEIRAALCQAAHEDQNPAVRLKALEVLTGAQDDPDVMQAMVAALGSDDNSGVRIEAVNSLLAALDDQESADVSLNSQARDVLRDRVQNDPVHYIRMRSAAALNRLVSLESDESGSGDTGSSHP
jgi:HEAT repeat protein